MVVYFQRFSCIIPVDSTWRLTCRLMGMNGNQGGSNPSVPAGGISYLQFSPRCLPMLRSECSLRFSASLIILRSRLRQPERLISDFHSPAPLSGLSLLRPCGGFVTTGFKAFQISKSPPHEAGFCYLQVSFPRE